MIPDMAAENQGAAVSSPPARENSAVGDGRIFDQDNAASQPLMRQ